MKTIHASAVVLIDDNGKVLVTERPPHKEIMPGYWEFPGGKLHDGETPDIAAKREIMEELGMGTGALLPLTFISEERAGYHIIVYVFTCRNWSGVPEGKEGQGFKWVHNSELDKLDNMLPSNIGVIPFIQNHCRNK